jgi:hypothetical protein
LWLHAPALVLTLTLSLILGAGWLTSQASADGDPASDVLASQSLYLPGDAGIPAAQQARLSALLSAAARGGFPARVALIASPADLGSIGELWRGPERYARFLGQELGQVFHGTLLVVMPNGFGVYSVGGRGVPVEVPSGLRIPDSAPALASAATSAVKRLAAAAGVRLSLPAAPGSSTAGGRGSIDLAAWIAFATGLVVIAAAWGASLRARPLRRGAAPSGG